MKIVIVISANAEWNAVKPLFPNTEMRFSPFGECFDAILSHWQVTFFHAGWGKVASAGAMQYIIDHLEPDVVINLGTCGGFDGMVQQGDVILVEHTFIYDIVELMDVSDVSPYYVSSLDLSWLAATDPYPTRRGVLASADSDLLPENIPLLKAKGAVAADWESGALAWVAAKNKTRLLILRAVSDLVSEQGGEAYGDIELFNKRTLTIMKKLIEQLPAWLDRVRL